MSVALLLAFPRSGGTVLSKCIACLPNTVLMSEVHPRGNAAGSIRDQAFDWYGLKLDDGDYLNSVSQLGNLCKETDKKLVIRDYTFMDFVPNPGNGYVAPNRLTSYEALGPVLKVKPVALVRDAIDVWISRWKPPHFFGAYRRFVEIILDQNIPLIRFEDFCADTAGTIRELAGLWELNYSESYQGYINYSNVTGDDQLVEQSRGRKQQVIRPLPRRRLSHSEINWVNRNEDMQWINKALGYPVHYHGVVTETAPPGVWVELRHWFEKLAGGKAKTDF